MHFRPVVGVGVSAGLVAMVGSGVGVSVSPAALIGSSVGDILDIEVAAGTSKAVASGTVGVAVGAAVSTGCVGVGELLQAASPRITVNNIKIVVRFVISHQ